MADIKKELKIFKLDLSVTRDLKWKTKNTEQTWVHQLRSCKKSCKMLGLTSFNSANVMADHLTCLWDLPKWDCYLTEMLQ